MLFVFQIDLLRKIPFFASNVQKDAFVEFFSLVLVFGGGEKKMYRIKLV